MQNDKTTAAIDIFSAEFEAAQALEIATYLTPAAILEREAARVAARGVDVAPALEGDPEGWCAIG